MGLLDDHQRRIEAEKQRKQSIRMHGNWWHSQHILVKGAIISFVCFILLGIIAINSDSEKQESQPKEASVTGLPDESTKKSISDVDYTNTPGYEKMQKDRLEQQFDILGSYIPLTIKLKSRLGDPSTYHHISTSKKWNEKNYCFLVTQKYRVPNVNGYLQTYTAICSCDKAGNLIDILQYE